VAESKKDKDKKGAAEAPPSGKSKLLLPIIGVVVLAGGGGGGYFWWSQQQAKPGSAPTVSVVPLSYHAFEPAFVVNFEGTQTFRFLQIEIQVAVRSPELAEKLKANDPLLRNDLLMLLGQQNSDFLATKEGKEKLRKEALQSVRKAVASIGGDPKKVENILFTSFVMQ
jgi:flagellar FliL protein